METKKSFVLFSVRINVMMKARASKARSVTSSVCPSFFYSTVTFKTQQNTLENTPDVIAKEFVFQHGQKKLEPNRHRRDCLFKQTN